MADGTQHGFNFPRKTLTSALRPGEIVVDFFAGGGGASEALRQALGRDPDVAVNHDHIAIGMHAANHPFTRHMEADVWTVDILREVAGRPVGWFHASPDCTHFSQAKGGQPRDRATRSLSWVIPKVIGKLARVGCAPRIFSMENVKQIQKWGPLIAKRDKATGRVITLDMVPLLHDRTGKPLKRRGKVMMVNRIASPGEQVPLRNQFLVPDKRREGRTWRQFVANIRAQGCTFEWRDLRACDYGAGTIRNRLFGIGRRDGQPIVWPDPTHGPGRANPYVTAADCIDWSVPCPSIFTRKKELADATMRRIAKGVQRYVLGASEPFIVPVTHQGERRVHPAGEPLPTITAAQRGELAAVGATLAPMITEHANASSQRTMPADQPLRTICAQVKGGHFAVVAPTLVQTGYGEREGQAPRSLDIEQPLGTIVGGGVKHAIAAAHLVKFRGESKGASAADPMPTITSGAGAARPAGAAHAMGVITAFLEQANGGGENGNPARARGADEPVSTISTTGAQQRLVTAHMAKLRGTSSAADVADPLATVSAGGEHHAVVECTLSPEHEAGALRVAAFLMRYHGTGGQHAELGSPITTITTKDRLALVTVTIRGTPYVIVDIGLRMLRREELFRAQGFPPDYIIDRTADGTPLSISASVRMVGNSVSPPPLAAIARANLDPVQQPQAVAA